MCQNSTDFSNSDAIFYQYQSLNIPVICADNYKGTRISSPISINPTLKVSFRIYLCNNRTDCYSDYQIQDWLKNKYFITNIISTKEISSQSPNINDHFDKFETNVQRTTLDYSRFK